MSVSTDALNDNNREEKTVVEYDPKNTIKFAIEGLYMIKYRHDVCTDSNGPSVILTTDVVKNAYYDLKRRGIEVRWVTEITKENLSYCKRIMEFAKLRHLEVKGNFGIGDGVDYRGSATSKPGEPPSQLIISNVRAFVEQQQYFFDMLWNKAVPAEKRIKELNEGTEPEVIETFRDPYEIQDKYITLIKSAKNQILLIIPTINAIELQDVGLKILELLKDVSIKKNIRIKLLCPPLKENSRSKLKEEKYDHVSSNIGSLLGSNHYNNILIGNMEPNTSNKSVILIIDKKESLNIELKDDNDSIKKDFIDIIGFAVYTNSKFTALSYISIFESFWKQAELIEKLKESEELQKDFIHIAAHELKNPIQPLLSLSDILQSKIKDKEYCKMLNIINRNAKKLKQLTNDILDVTKIETKNLSLSKELFDLNELIYNIVEDYRNQVDSRYVSLSYTFDNYYGHDKTKLEGNDDFSKNTFLYLSSFMSSLSIFVDKSRLIQVISNLLDNAIRFTKQGSIDVIVKKRDDAKEIIINIKDTGSGIDKEIFPRLFTKFATKSDKGTGLGLYISKNIIEAHGGKIWAKNNDDGKGATFGFNLPLIYQ